MNKPWLSVLMPVYNGERYLPQTLHSILVQGDNDIECIVIDDGSTDSTPAVINSYIGKLPIRLIRQAHTGNWSANTNVALNAAAADYVCILHQDDLWLEGRLGAMRSLIEESHEANLLIQSSWFINEKGNRVGIWRSPLPSFPKVIDADTMLSRLLVQNFISIPAPIFKRKIAIDVGGLDPGLWYTPDWDLWLKIAPYGEIIYQPKPYSAFRIHPVSQTVIQSADIQNFGRELETVLERHLELWKAAPRVKSDVRRTARFSIQVNISLAALLHGRNANFFKLVRSFLGMGPVGWYIYFRDSRITERLFARMRAKLRATPNP